MWTDESSVVLSSSGPRRLFFLIYLLSSFTVVIVIVIVTVITFSPSVVSFLPCLASETEQAKGKRKARAPLKLASEHEAWISSSPATNALHLSPARPSWGAGGLPTTGARPRPQTDREDARPKAAHLQAPPTVLPPTQVPSFLFKEWVAVCTCVCGHVRGGACVWTRAW